MTPLYYDPQSADGLHVLKDKWKQKSYLGQQSQWLRDNLTDVIAATWKAAHVRTQGFQLSRSATEMIHDSEQERRLEAALFLRWNRPGMSPNMNCWDRLVAFQVPLFGQQKKEHWGYIDLLGVDSNGLPVVVELKKAPEATDSGGTKATETPLRIVLEAAAYGVALRRNWDGFRPEWITRLREIGVDEKTIERVPQILERVPLVAAAPASFWIDWLPVTAKGKEFGQEARSSFQRLLHELDNQLLPVSFVSISGHDQDVEGLAVQPLDFPFIS